MLLLVDAGKAQPGKFTYGSSGTGGGPHLAGELFQLMSGARWTHVPFKGAAPAAIAVMSGEVDFSFGSTNALLEPVRSGKVRAVGVTGGKRFAPLPAVPTIGESGIPGYLAVGWYGFYGPANMPAELVRRIHGEIGQNPCRASTLERQKAFHHGAFAINPAILRGTGDHAYIFSATEAATPGIASVTFSGSREEVAGVAERARARISCVPCNPASLGRGCPASIIRIRRVGSA